MSFLGWNPQFNNQEKSVEVHILKAYESDFYGKEIRVIVIGFLRPMLKFDSLGIRKPVYELDLFLMLFKEGLIEAIRNDIATARAKLADPAAKALKDDPFWTAGKGN
jgi:riboflavin kinase